MGSGDGPSIADAASVIHKAATSSSVHEISGQQKMRVVDLPLLFACKLLDLQLRGYFSLYNLETIVGSLALPISRYQVISIHCICLFIFVIARQIALAGGEYQHSRFDAVSNCQLWK